ncbi:50S ribosomal protein L11 [Impatiens glandulifera]|uniref:50S ribosomal protein L11 n=1 Tax=Impatiens glandulifera TaxID=253017 RepID=UPI001FB0B8C2|nr:50S ribosomal protein L11 [Impatiens glandulifera]
MDTIKLTVPAGGSRPGPPVGPDLGEYKLNSMAFFKDFNARTQKSKSDAPVAVTITANKDDTFDFDFTVKSPSVTWYLKKAAGDWRGIWKQPSRTRCSLNCNSEARLRNRKGIGRFLWVKHEPFNHNYMYVYV